MASEWLNLKQGNKIVDKYELEFCRLLHFAGEGYRDNARMKVQKFHSGLNPEIRYDMKMFDSLL